MASATIDVPFPSLIGAAKIDWSLERNVAVLQSPLSRSVQEVARGGDLWKATIEMPVLVDDDAAAIATWLDLISQAGYRGLVPVLQNDLIGTESGSAAFAELAGPWQTATDWLYDNSHTVAKLLDGGLFLQALADNASQGYYVVKTFATTPGMYYQLSVDIPPQQTFGWRVWRSFNVGSGSTGGTNVDTGLQTTFGRQQWLNIAGSGGQAAVVLYAGQGFSDFQWTRYGDVSLSRVYTVRDNVPAGWQALVLQGGDTNYALSAPAIKRGQFFAVLTTWGWELKRATSSPIMLNAIQVNGVTVTHAGDLRFEPALRGALYAGAPIRHIGPYCRMMPAKRVSASTISAPKHQAFVMELVEDVS